MRGDATFGVPVGVQVLSLHFRTYILALERLQMDLATKNDLIGVSESRNVTAGLFSRGRDLKNRSAVFALGDRINLLKVGSSPRPQPAACRGGGGSHGVGLGVLGVLGCEGP